MVGANAGRRSGARRGIDAATPRDDRALHGGHLCRPSQRDAESTGGTDRAADHCRAHAVAQRQRRYLVAGFTAAEHTAQNSARDVIRDPRRGAHGAARTSGLGGHRAARMVAQSMTSVTNMTSQAPAPVSVRTSEVLIHRPSVRTASTRSPLNVTISPGRRCAKTLAIAGVCGMTCVLALWEIIISRARRVAALARQ